MNHLRTPIPFGILFMEPAPQPKSLLTPMYDEVTSISFVEDSQGRQVPYVEFEGAIGTDTETFVTNETTDRDEERLSALSTVDTVTKAAEPETTNDDPQHSSAVG